MDLNILILTAFSIGFVHTIIGPDHYLPFVMIGRAQNWTIRKTIGITMLCGVGHVIGSVVLGIIGIAFGVMLGLLNHIESVRGDIAAWLLIGLGTAYSAWGLRIALRKERHYDGKRSHSHSHLGKHVHLDSNPGSVTPWLLFIIFVLGPCEPLIPILMYPASQGNWFNLLYVTVVFGVTTILTMTGAVILMASGLARVELAAFEKYSHALAGAIIAVSGLSIKILGL